MDLLYQNDIHSSDPSTSCHFTIQAVSIFIKSVGASSVKQAHAGEDPLFSFCPDARLASSAPESKT